MIAQVIGATREPTPLLGSLLGEGGDREEEEEEGV